MPTVAVRRIIAAPQADVWDAIADIENAGRWNQAWQHIEILSHQREGLGTAFRAHSEGGRVDEFEIVAWQPPELIAFAPRQTETRVAPAGGEASAGDYLTVESQAFYLHPISEAETELEVMASVSTRGLRGWLVGRLLWPGYQKQGLRRALDAIAALFTPEQGEGANESS